VNKMPPFTIQDLTPIPDATIHYSRFDTNTCTSGFGRGHEAQGERSGKNRIGGGREASFGSQNIGLRFKNNRV